HPGKRQLWWRASLLTRDLFAFANQIDILLKVFTLETRDAAAKIIRREVLEMLNLTGEEAAAERAISNKSDAEFAASGENLVFGIARPERAFRLQCSDGMNPRCAATSTCASFVNAHVTDLGFLAQ